MTLKKTKNGAGWKSTVIKMIIKMGRASVKGEGATV